MGYNVAIDGPAGAGKSTIAKLVAKEKGYIYVDTGAMYRALAVHFLEKGIAAEDTAGIIAKRRYDELTEKGLACDYEEIAKDIRERDERDMNRETAPLRQAEDAVLVDSSDMTIPEVVETIVRLCR